MRHLSKQGVQQKKFNAKVDRLNRLLAVNAHLLRRLGESLPKVSDPLRSASLAAWLNEKLILMNHDWLDEVTEAVTGKATLSTSREEAARRCLLAIEEATGVCFPRPLRTSTVGLDPDSTVPMTLTHNAQEKTMTQQDTASKSSVQQMPTADQSAATKPVAEKKASKKKAPPPIKPNLGKTKVSPKKKGGVKHGEMKIVVLTKGGKNPRVEGTDGWKHFELYKKAKTVQALFDAVKPADRHKTRIRLNTDRRDGHVKLAK